MWFQGEDNMPEIVQMCFHSWKKHNPHWNIQLLTTTNLIEHTNIAEVVGPNWGSIPPAAKSDLIRIQLLASGGGVWADASTYCTQPLDDWLPKNLSSGFFAFAHPNKDRLISSWFMASYENQLLTKHYAAAAIEFWKKHTPRVLLERQLSYSGVEALAKWLYQTNPIWAVHSAFMRLTGISHYFWFHYIFTWLVKVQPGAKHVWDSTPKVAADGPHKLLHFGYREPIDAKMKEELDRPSVPVYKLNWRYSIGDIPDSAMDYLYQHFRENV